jgi:arylsulfatase A-like enzyme
MITSMDDEIGKVIAALDKKKMRDNTLIVFMSDNGGNVSAMFSGDVDVSKLKLPADNGPYRGGKGMLYEGGTRVAALANWPGRIKAGEVKEVIHVVDMFPTLAGLAGANVNKGKSLDGLDVWSTISEGKPSPRQEVVYNIEPFRGGVRRGDWKLVWRTPLPSSLELFNLAEDPSEKTNLADKNPQKVAELQKRIEELAKESAKSLFLLDAFAAVKGAAHGAPALPNEETYFTQGD